MLKDLEVGSVRESKLYWRIWVIKNHEITYDLQDKRKDNSLSFSPAEQTGEENFEDKILKGGEICNIPDPETLSYWVYTFRGDQRPSFDQYVQDLM